MHKKMNELKMIKQAETMHDCDSLNHTLILQQLNHHFQLVLAVYYKPSILKLECC